MKYYLYTCYCGPQRTRMQEERGGGNYIYENCPMLSAPYLNNTLEDLLDYRAEYLRKNIDEVKNVFRRFGCSKAHLIGSFVQNQTKSSSDMDFATDIDYSKINLIDEINKELSLLLNIKVDVIPYFFLQGQPHYDLLEKASIVIFDDTNWKIVK